MTACPCKTKQMQLFVKANDDTVLMLDAINSHLPVWDFNPELKAMDSLRKHSACKISEND